MISGRHLDELRAEPGQFFRWRFLTRDLWWTSLPVLAVRAAARRPAAHHGEGGSATTARALRGSRPAPGSSPRARTARSPRRRRRRRKVLLIAGGVGITPLRALFETLPAAPGDLTLIYRVSSMRDVVFRRELEQLAERRGAGLVRRRQPGPSSTSTR